MEKITDIYFDSLKTLFKAPDFKKSIDDFYISKVKEFEYRKKDSDFKEYLNKQYKEISKPFFQNKRLAKLYPKLSNEIEFVCVTMESLLNQIDIHLKDLEAPKPKNKTIQNGHTATILSNFNLEGVNAVLFEKSDIIQWRNVFDTQKLKKPIKLKEDVTLKDLSYFLQELSEKYSFNYEYQKCLETIGAFLFNRKIITSSQLSGAKQDSKNAIAPLKNEIDSLFKR